MQFCVQLPLSVSPSEVLGDLWKVDNGSLISSYLLSLEKQKARVPFSRLRVTSSDTSSSSTIEPRRANLTELEEAVKRDCFPRLQQF